MPKTAGCRHCYNLDSNNHSTQRTACRAHLVEVVGGGDDVEAAELRELELADLDAREADLLPRRRGVGLAGRVDGLVEAREVDEARREAAKVLDVEVEDAGGLVARLLVAAVAALLDLRLVRACTHAAMRDALISSQQHRRNHRRNDRRNGSGSRHDPGAGCHTNSNHTA